MSESHAIVSRQEWLAARGRLLAREKQITQWRDELGREQRALPWVRVEKRYEFQTERGAQTLAELFDGRRQLVVYHFMFAPHWEQACKSCSFWADHFSGLVPHLAARDVRFTAVARAPLPKLVAYAARLGWTFPFASSGDSGFNFDFGVSFRPDEIDGAPTYNYASAAPNQEEQPGISVFYRGDDGEVLHTYSCYGRGIELLNPTYAVLDVVPKGRDEAGLAFPMAWVRRSDEY